MLCRCCMENWRVVVSMLLVGNGESGMEILNKVFEERGFSSLVVYEMKWACSKQEKCIRF
jgi:hypothetical protein